MQDYRNTEPETDPSEPIETVPLDPDRDRVPAPDAPTGDDETDDAL